MCGGVGRCVLLVDDCVVAWRRLPGRVRARANAIWMWLHAVAYCCVAVCGRVCVVAVVVVVVVWLPVPAAACLQVWLMVLGAGTAACLWQVRVVVVRWS